jgi:hypothetical protein
LVSGVSRAVGDRKEEVEETTTTTTISIEKKRKKTMLDLASFEQSFDQFQSAFLDYHGKFKRIYF